MSTVPFHHTAGRRPVPDPVPGVAHPGGATVYAAGCWPVSYPTLVQARRVAALVAAGGPVVVLPNPPTRTGRQVVLDGRVVFSPRRTPAAGSTRTSTEETL